ncbi:MAG TPA: efflux RND transporter periplasmic adaptor subunit, partial [Candidatus Polarisedimenticolaceae bacterium]|nr:efflux RND transporter periplasmic adaptor subunit [Candidatus Polarisedimenticolaceae bacterium]
MRPQPVEAERFASYLYVERDARLTARMSGVVQAVHAERGDRVRQGQLLAELESDLARGELRKAEQQFELAKAEYRRTQALSDRQMISEQEALRRKIEHDLAASEVELRQARLERCMVRAPFDGVVVERTAAVGQRVTEDDNTELFRVVASDPLRARLDVPEERMAGVSPGERAWIEAGTAAPQPARVIFVSPTVDPASGTTRVIVQADGRDRALRVGAAIAVRFDETTASAPLFQIPSEALIEEAAPGEGRLLVAVANRAEERRVQVRGVLGGLATVSG